MNHPDNHGSSSDLELIEKYKAGEIQAFDVLFSRYIHRIVGYSYSLIGDREEAKDVAQEVFIKIFGSLDSFRGEGSFTSWIFTITRRAIIDRQRRKRVNTSPIELSPETNLDQGVSLEGLDSVPMEIGFLSGLTPIEREVLVLRCVDELSYREISNITGLTEGSLRKVMMRALERAAGEVKIREL